MAEGREGVSPPILTLLDAFDEHRAAYVYDWRTRFGLPLDALPDVMDWSEAVELSAILERDPSSWVAAARAGWQYPMDRTTLTLSDLYDATANAHFKKPKRYPRPWDEAPKVFGNARLTKDRLRAILDAHRGHN